MNDMWNHVLEGDQIREMETADKRMRMMKITTAMKEPMREAEVRPQKPPNCWQIANQLEFGLPWCAISTIAAAAEAAAVSNPIAACSNQPHLNYLNMLLFKLSLTQYPIFQVYVRICHTKLLTLCSQIFLTLKNYKILNLIF